MVLNYISLVANDVEYFLCLFTMCISSMGKPLYAFYPFASWAVSLILLLNFRSSSDVLDTRFLTHMICCILPQSVAFLSSS